MAANQRTIDSRGWSIDDGEDWGDLITEEEEFQEVVTP
jgi:hypothetical protein